MNLGLLDAACLAEELGRARERGNGFGDLAVLRRYERRRKGDNVTMLLAFDALDRLFPTAGRRRAVAGDRARRGRSYARRETISHAPCARPRARSATGGGLKDLRSGAPIGDRRCRMYHHCPK